MTDPSRLSDILGLESKPPETESVWPLNFVLLVLGTAILVVAFTFLDPSHPRPLYNPWTYAIATPLALMGLSALLSSVVSRVVEKSMQLAFLLSVLVHLMLMVGAMNVVIYSRMWPDVLDSLEQQRQQLKRQTLHAKQYHRVSITKQAGSRPDYLKPVATEHQPTELEQIANPTLALASSPRANLISPSPKVELTHSASLRRRDQPAVTAPAQNSPAASLSRSELETLRNAMSQPEFDYQPAEATEPTPLQPTASALARKPNESRSTLQPTPAQPAPSPLASSVPSLDRQLSQALPLLDRSQKFATALERQQFNELRPNQPAPNRVAEADSELRPGIAPELAVNAATSRDRRASTESVSLTNPALQTPSGLNSNSALNALAARTPPRQVAPALPPTPAGSELSSVIPRQIAGGQFGAAAPSSMPVSGVPDIGLSKPVESAEPKLNSSITDQRRSNVRSSLSRLSNAGELGGATWNATPSLSDGLSGLAPSPLTNSPVQGNATTDDAARLTGAARDLQRAMLNRPAAPSPTTVPGADSLLSSLPSGAASLGGALDFSGANPAPLAAAGAEIDRAKSGLAEVGQSVLNAPADASSLGPSSLGQTFHGGNRVQAAPLPDSQSASTNPLRLATQFPAAQLPSKDALTAQVPDLPTIQIPDEAFSTLDSAPAAAVDPLASSSSLARRPGTLSESRESAGLPTELLAVDAVPGPGGIASMPDMLGSLLNRRNTERERWTPPTLEAQRLARQDVGGPLAAGQQVALPKPAFQQRIDRLKDRDLQDESSLQPQTELAIERGLEFLAQHQRSDGSWRLQDFDTPVLIRSDTAATALAVLAFQGAGYTHNQFKYATTVDKALKFLIGHQAANGDLYIPQDPASDQNAWLYSHAIASLAMCEAVGMTQDDQLRPAAQKALDFMVASQDPRRGGWRYRPGAGADTSVTGWFMMAFKSGQLAGLNVPTTTMDSLERFLVASQSPAGEPHLFRYNPYAADTPQQRHGLQPTSVMTSVGLLMRLYTGWKRDRTEMMDGADYLLTHLPEHGTETASKRDTYYWYYATQVMFHMRGQRWQTWHDRLYPLLIQTQITDGELAGSWDPMFPTPDLWARYGGRLYVTTLNLLSLEVSYRHLPLYEATGK
jgi:hypothetical protein